jgi:methylmalonyl-CoA mutase
VTPFDAPLHTPGKLSRAVARNVQTILLEEAFLGHVIDPAGGSWYVESLTTELARKAWSEFQEIEAVGGLRQAVVSGLVEDRLAALRDKRSQGFARRRDTIVGITDFLSSDDQGTDRDLPLTSRRDGARLRWSEPFEALRQRADAYQQLVGRPPQVSVVELGDLSETAPLVNLVGRLLSPGGVVTVRAPSAEHPPSRGEAGFGADATTVVCICCAGAEQEPLAEETMRLLRDAGAQLVMALFADPTIELPGADLVLHEEMDVLQLADRVLHEVGA